jgi:hypothetical protein
MSPPVVPGKVSRHWYIPEDVALQLRHRCVEEGKIESHVVTEAIQAMLELTKAKGLQGQNL